MNRLQRLVARRGARCAVCVEAKAATQERRFVCSMLWPAKVAKGPREVSSGVFVSTRGDVIIAIGVHRVDIVGKEEAQVACASILELHIDHPSPEAVLVAARMLGGMASVAD